MLGKPHTTVKIALRASFAVLVGTAVLLSQVRAQDGPHVEVGVKGSPSRVAPENARSTRNDAIRAEARTALDHGDYAKAESILRRALAIDRTDAQSWVLLADVCERQGKTDDAIQAYRAMIYSQGWGSSINHDPTTVMRYVLLLSKKGAWAEAAAVYNDAEQRKMAGTGRPLAGFHFSQRTPDWPGLKAAAGFVLGTYHVSYAHGQTVDQVKHLEQAIKYRPNWPEAQIAYADCMLKKGELDKAEAAYKAAQRSTDWSLKLRAKDGLWAVSHRRSHPVSQEVTATGSPAKK